MLIVAFGILLHFNTNQFNVEINADNHKNVYRRHYNLKPNPPSSVVLLLPEPHQLRYNYKKNPLLKYPPRVFVFCTCTSGGHGNCTLCLSVRFVVYERTGIKSLPTRQ